MDELKIKLSQWQKPVIGIGVTAFTRVGPGFLLPNYSIICLLETADLESIRQTCLVYSLEKDFKIKPEKLEKQNTSSIMLQPPVYSFLKSLDRGTSLLPYKSSKKIEKICQQLGIKILSSPSSIRGPFEDKKEFRVLGRKAGLRLIPGETLLIDDLDEAKYEEARKKYGPDLVFQLPDYKIGGGIGTLFIKHKDDWQEFMAFVKRRRNAGRELIWVNVTKFIKGISASISACVTRQGVLCGLVQTQLNDIPEATAFKGRKGVWCGHDWGWKQFNLGIQKKAEKIAKALGKFMYKKGYLGVFGIDLIIDKKDDLWPVECNSRYTGGFPVYSMMQNLYNEPSFDAFHLLEFLNIDYQVDLKKVQQLYQRPKTGAHLILRNQSRKWVKVKADIKGGVYQLKEKELVWQRPGFALEHLKNEDEFCLVDRAALKGRILKPGERLVRILFKDKIALSSNRLTEKASFICKKVYRAYALKVIPSRTIKEK